MAKKSANPGEDPGPFGSSFDSFLEEAGILEEVHACAVRSLSDERKSRLEAAEPKG